MGSPTPKVLLSVGGRSLLSYVVDSAREAGAERIVVVTGSGQEQVREAFKDSGLEYAVQAEPRGTADAVLACSGLLEDDEECVVLYGDAPLITARTIHRLVEARAEAGADLAVFTARLDEPGDYGRVVRAEGECIARIVEKRDATETELRVTEVNSGLCSFRWGRVKSAIERVRPSPHTGEYYLTDAVRELVECGGKVIAVLGDDPDEMLGANTPEEFDRVEAALESRKASRA